MSGKENKRSRGRRPAKTVSSNTPSRYSPRLSQLLAGLSSTSHSLAQDDTTMNCEVPTDFAFRSVQEDAEKITELMDAPLDFDIPAHAISKGPNPYLDRCMYCNAPRTTAPGDDEGTEFLDLQLDGNTVITSQNNAQPFGSLKVEIWTCRTCRKVAGNFQSFLESNLPPEEAILPDSIACSPLSCNECEDESDCREVSAQESHEINQNWEDLRSLVEQLHTSVDEPVLSLEQGNQLKLLIKMLCQNDPHQLFLRLESQVREMVIGIKTGLIQKLNDNGVDNPALALDFTSTLLCHYDFITKKAHLLAQYLGELTDHLKQFQVTWELLNKHLFHSIAHNDPAISSVGPTILEQLRQGSLQYERSREDPFCSVRKRLLKFQEEMSVVVVVWRDCQQLIENYCQEEFTNTQKQVSHRAKCFITQQRQLLKNHVMKDSFMDEETMKNLVSGHRSSEDKVLCHRCKRERCTCDECTITHMITCGIINTEKGTTLPPPPSSFNFALDHTHNVMDITPPSMSSTTSSSGSVSPINVEDKMSTYYDCEKVLSKELRNALKSCEGKDKRLKGLTLDDLIDNIDNNGDDEDDIEDLEDADNCADQHDGSDEPHAMQLPVWDTLEAHQLLQSHNGEDHISLNTDGSVRHSCSQCHQFQPRIDSHLTKQLEAEIAISGSPSCNMNEFVANSLAGSSDNVADSMGNSSNVLNPNICATCQCHACLKQSGHVVSTSLPLQVPVSPPPAAEFNLYPHIHGLPPHRYLFGLPSPLLPAIKLPFKVDSDDPTGLHDHLYAYSEWDNPRPGSLAAQHQHQSHHQLSSLTSDLLPPAPVVDAIPAFSFEALSLTSHSPQLLTNTSSAFRSSAGESVAFNENSCAEGSSVDPATKPLDFSSLMRIPQTCLNSTSSSLPLFTSVPSAVLSSAASSFPMTATTSSNLLNGSCQGPPSSRPVPLGGNAAMSSKWEKTHTLQCKKFSASGPNKYALLNQQGEPVNPFSTTNLQSAPSVSVSQNNVPFKNLSTHHPKSLQSPLPYSHSSSPSSAKLNETQTSATHTQGANHSSASFVPSVSSCSSISTNSLPTSCPNAKLQSTIVNNIGVGTTAPCVDSECKVHHEDNCDSVDDSCSERSSSTSSTQKEGKYCDCCYCEFFGHNNPQGAKTSPNYFEMKDRLRKKLKKKNEKKQSTDEQEPPPQIEEIKEKEKEEPKAPMEKRGLDELVSFINGTDESNRNKPTNKAAKRARQKQRKLEEKVRQENASQACQGNHVQPKVTKSLSNLILNPPCNAESNSSEHQGRVQRMTPSDQERIHELHMKLTLLKEEMKQETTRSSMFIESTRPTISHKPVTKNGNIDKVLDMIQQTLKHTQQCQHGTTNGKKDTQQCQHGTTNGKKDTQQCQHGTTIGKKAQSPAPVASNNEKISEKDRNANGLLTSKPVPVETKKSVPHTKDLPAPQVKHPPPPNQSPQPTKSFRNQKVDVATNSVPNGRGTFQSVEKKTTTPSASNVPSHPKVIASASGGTNSSKIPAATTASVSKVNTTNSAASTMASAPNKVTVMNNVPSPKNVKSSSESPTPTKSKGPAEQTKTPNGKSKKNKKKNKSESDEEQDPEEVFMPKSESELDGSIDDWEREFEKFKRFCFETEPQPKRKLAVNVNLKDIFKKKSTLA